MIFQVHGPVLFIVISIISLKFDGMMHSNMKQIAV